MTIQQKIICAQCGATNLGAHDDCLICGARLPAADAVPAEPEQEEIKVEVPPEAQQDSGNGVAEALIEAPAPAPSKAFCTNCGAPRVEGKKFCTNCGQAWGE